MNQTHTPGPWFVGTGWVGAARTDPPTASAKIDKRTARVIATVPGYPYGDTEANLRLLAVAPELLEQLEALVVQIDAAGLIVPPGVKEVIAKARGRK